MAGENKVIPSSTNEGSLSNAPNPTLLEDAMKTINPNPIPRDNTEHVMYDATFGSHVKQPRKKRILVVGAVGAGKSSLVNMLAENVMTPVGDDAYGCTQDIIAVTIKHNDVEYEFIDSPGLDRVSTAESTIDGPVPKLFIYLASEQKNISCVLFVWRKGRINNAFNQSTHLLKDQLMKRAIPFILVVTGCEMDEDLEQTRTILQDELKEFSFNGIVCGTTQFGGALEQYTSEIRQVMKAELWQRIEQCCDDSFIIITNNQDDSSSEIQSDPLWWRIIQRVCQYLVAGYEMGIAVGDYAVSMIGDYVYVRSTRDGGQMHVTHTPSNERHDQCEEK